MLLTATLSIGFEGDTLSALRQAFDLRYAISSDPSADMNWHELHDLRLAHDAPDVSEEMMACLSFVKSHFFQFHDINSRRHYYVPGREAETINGFMLTFYALYRLLKEHDIKLVLHANIPHEGFDFILYQIAQFLRIKTVLCYQSLIENRFWLANTINDFGFFTQNPVLFEREESHYSLPQNWFYMAGSKRDAAYNMLDLFSEIVRRPYRLPLALVRYAYAWQFRVHVAALTQKRPAGEKYVYFPLHLQPELTTAALGDDYADQLLALERLSAWLPDDYMIYVKENPKQTEKQRGPFFYKRLAALKNVRLLARDENSVELIQNSIAVATITGTAGWEALFYGKPVIIFGAAWYREFPGVYAFRSELDINDLLLFAPCEHSALVNKLDEALQTAGKGVVDPAYAVLVKNYDPEINAKFVADSLLRYVSAAQI